MVIASIIQSQVFFHSKDTVSNVHTLSNMFHAKLQFIDGSVVNKSAVFYVFIM